MQAAGNDFIVMEAVEVNPIWSVIAQKMCNRRFGIGADGLIFVLPSKRADFEMRIFNADGSEAEACGNGIRCFARYVSERGLAPAGKDELRLGTLAGISRARLFYQAGRLSKIQVSMGQPVFTPTLVPVKAPARDDIILDYPLVVEGCELRLGFVSMGNPHAVLSSDQPVAEFPLVEVGPKVENHAMFPNRINFEVARVVDRSSVEARVWERGVGETPACGTGACAIAVIGQKQGLLDNQVRVKLPGGTLEVTWNGKGEVLLSGPAEPVFTGEWPD
jgi:diaminopimelate epimerase